MHPAQAPSLRIAVVGAGPAGLALALLAAQRLPQARICVFDARAAERDVSADPRTLALALGSVQLLQRLQAWPADAAAPILEVHVSQAAPGWQGWPAGLEAALTELLGPAPAAELRIRAGEQGVDFLGAVLGYGALLTALQARWLALCQREPQRFSMRFAHAVQALKPLPHGVEVDAGVVEAFDLAVVAEGGVFAEQERKALQHDYRQSAWVGQVELQGAAPGVAFERFTRQGPVALLPLPQTQGGAPRWALVWCVEAADDAVESLSDAQRLAVLAALLPAAAGKPAWISALKRFALGLNAEHSLVQGRFGAGGPGRIVRIGNAAQTLHPVAGQGLNLALRDVYGLVDALHRTADVDAALRRVDWARAGDRWSMIAATDFLARSFTWRWPGLGLARGAALAGLDRLQSLKSALARQMMFGRR